MPVICVFWQQRISDKRCSSASRGQAEVDDGAAERWALRGEVSASARVAPREGAEWWKEETQRKKVTQSERGLWNWSIWDLTGLFFPLELPGRAPSHCRKIKSRITSSCGEVRVMLLIGRLCATTSGSSQRDSSRRHLCSAEVFELCHPIFISNDDFLTWLTLCMVTSLWNSYLLFCLQSGVDLEGDLPRPVIFETMVDCASRSPSPAAAASEHGEVQQWGVSHSPQPLHR